MKSLISLDVQKKNAERFPTRPGRLITVDNVKWKWTCSPRGTILAYSETGEKALTHAYNIKGFLPQDFERGQWKRTSDGAVTPNEIRKWIQYL